MEFVILDMFYVFDFIICVGREDDGLGGIFIGWMFIMLVILLL